MKFVPFHYQETAIQWLKDRRVSALFMEPGLGKTVIVLLWICWLITTGQARRALVVAPKRVCSITWPNEIARWDFCKHLRIAQLRNPEGIAKWYSGEFEIGLINSELLPTIEKNLKCKYCDATNEWCGLCKDGFTLVRYPGFVEKHIIGNCKNLPVDALVVDELSLAKSHASVRFNALRSRLHDKWEKRKGKLVKTFTSPFKFITGLTGTPAPNSYHDLFAQVRLLDDGERLGKHITHYERKYFDRNFNGYGHTIKDGAKEEIDAKLADLALVMLGEDYLDIPPCETVDVEVDLPAAVRKAYRTLEKELLVQLETGEIEALSAAVLANKLLQLTAGSVFDSEKNVHLVHDAKIDALRRVRKQHPGEPILVLTGYTHEQERYLKAFPEGRKFHERDMAAWQRGEIPLWFSHPGQLSHGIDSLQKSCRIMVWATQTWSNETYIQTVARLRRKGQTRSTTIYRLLAKDTYDEAVIETVRERENSQRGLLNSLKNLQKFREI